MSAYHNTLKLSVLWQAEKYSRGCSTCEAVPKLLRRDDPFVGNGFTKTPSGELGKPEYNTIGYCQIKNNAAIYELSRDGKEILVAIRIRNKWRKLED